MPNDPAIGEIRKARHEISARFGHDTKALIQHYKELEKRFQSRILRQRPAPSSRKPE